MLPLAHLTDEVERNRNEYKSVDFKEIELTESSEALLASLYSMRVH